MKKAVFMAVTVFLTLAAPVTLFATSPGKDIPRQAYRISHYCSCSICCGKWSDGRFANNEKTASCTTPTIACNWLPFGTEVVIDGTTYIVRDRGAKKYFGTKIEPKYAFDIYCQEHNDAKNKGIYYTKNVFFKIVFDKPK